jgi:hypothetical protein
MSSLKKLIIKVVDLDDNTHGTEDYSTPVTNELDTMIIYGRVDEILDTNKSIKKVEFINVK